MSEPNKIPAESLVHRISKRLSLFMAIEATLAIGTSYFLGMTFARLVQLDGSFISGLWCVISTILVLQVMMKQTVKQAWLRIFGSVMGSLTSGIVATLFGYGVGSLCLSIFLTIILVSLFRVKKTFRLACLTVSVIIVIGMVHPDIPPWMNAVSRLAESMIGAGVAVFFSWALLPLRKRYQMLKEEL